MIRNDALHHGADYTPYEGLEVQGWPVTVILRGQIAVDKGKLLLDPGAGTYLSRKRSAAK